MILFIVGAAVGFFVAVFGMNLFAIGEDTPPDCKKCPYQIFDDGSHNCEKCHGYGAC